MSADEADEMERLKARQRAVWRVMRAGLHEDFGVTIESGRTPRTLGEARISLSFHCVFDIGMEASDAEILAMVGIARERLIENVTAWPTEPI